MATSQTTVKIQRGLKFVDEFKSCPSTKNPKRERPVHKSYLFAENC